MKSIVRIVLPCAPGFFLHGKIWKVAKARVATNMYIQFKKTIKKTDRNEAFE